MCMLSRKKRTESETLTNSRNKSRFKNTPCYWAASTPTVSPVNPVVGVAT